MAHLSQSVDRDVLVEFFVGIRVGGSIFSDACEATGLRSLQIEWINGLRLLLQQFNYDCINLIR